LIVSALVAFTGLRTRHREVSLTADKAAERIN
jgi:hypothetical protein